MFGTEAQREKLYIKQQVLAFNPCQVKNLNVVFNSDLSFVPLSSLVRNITKSAFYHLKNIARVRPFLSLANTETLIHAFITCRIYYFNALFFGLTKKNLFKLQLFQNSAAHVLTKTRKRAHIALILKSLHWLPVCFRIDFKIILLVYKALTGLVLD